MIKCSSCAIEIPAKWKSAFVKNCCPQCGEKILDDTSSGLLEEIKAAMTEMPADPEALACWLLSNFRLTKLSEKVEAEQFHQAPMKGMGHQLQAQGQLQNNSAVFKERAGVNANPSNAKWADMLNKVNSQMQQEQTQNREVFVDETAVPEDIVNDEQILQDYATKKGRPISPSEAIKLLSGGGGGNDQGNLYIDKNGKPAFGTGGMVNETEKEALAMAIESLSPPDSPILEAERLKRLQRQHTSSMCKPISRVGD